MAVTETIKGTYLNKNVYILTYYNFSGFVLFLSCPIGHPMTWEENLGRNLS